MVQLYKGDCLELLKDIPDGSIDLILTDPPYGTTACKWDVVIPFEAMWKEINRIIKPKGVIVLFGSEPFSSLLRCSNLKNYKYDWVWDKIKGTGFLNSKKQPLRNHELISVFYQKQCLYNPQKTTGHILKKSSRKSHNQTDVYGKMSKDHIYESSERFPRSIQEFLQDTQNSSFHPTQKPVALLEYLIKTYTNVSDKVLDFTMGSGSTGVAAVNLGRDFIGIEREDKYFSIAEKRILEAEENTLF